MEGKKSPEEQEACWIQSGDATGSTLSKEWQQLILMPFAGSWIKTFKPAQQDGCRLVKEEHCPFMT